MTAAGDAPPKNAVAFVTKHRHFCVDLVAPDWSHTLWDESIVQAHESKIRPLLAIATRCRAYEKAPTDSGLTRASDRPYLRSNGKALEFDLSNPAAADADFWLGMLRGHARPIVEIPRESFDAAEYFASTWRPTWVDNLATILGSGAYRAGHRATKDASTIAMIPYRTAYAVSLAVIAPAATAVDLFRVAWTRAKRMDPEGARRAAEVLSPFDALLEAAVLFNQAVDAPDPFEVLATALQCAWESASNATLMARGLGAAELVAGIAGRPSARLSEKLRKWIERQGREVAALVPLATRVANAAIQHGTFVDMWPALPERARALETGIADLADRLSAVG